MPQGNIDAEMAQCDPFDDIFEMTEFGFFSAQKLSPGRNIIEQVPDLYGGAAGVSSRPDFEFIDRGAADAPGFILFPPSCCQAQAADRGDAGQSLPPEAQAFDPLEVVQAIDFAGRM